MQRLSHAKPSTTPRPPLQSEEFMRKSANTPPPLQSEEFMREAANKSPVPVNDATSVSEASWGNRLQKTIVDWVRAIKSIGHRSNPYLGDTHRPAPPGVYFILTYLSVRTKSGITGVEPGTQVVCVKDEGPVLLVKVDNLEFEAKRQYLTNDLNVAAHAGRDDAESQQAVAAYIAQQQRAIDQRNDTRKRQPPDNH